MVNNLLENARKYGKENGHIRVSLARHGREVVLEVEDDGIGIAPEHQEKIWQRFYQVSTSREGGAGLGLGLSMVRQIVRLHGGTIRVDSSLGHGSRFIILLPDSGEERVKMAVDEQEEDIRPPVEVDKNGGKKGGGER